MDISRVLRHYSPDYLEYTWRRFAEPGFSGAVIWQGSLYGLPFFALKQWPQTTDPKRLHFQLEEQAAASRAGLAFVPRVDPTSGGQLVAVTMGCHWTLSHWQPGAANYFLEPTRAKLKNAILALAELHRFWQRRFHETGSCPVVAERLMMLHEPIPSRLDIVRKAPEPLRELLYSLHALIEQFTPVIREQLRPFSSCQVNLHTCLRDVWHDHLLFTGDQLTGLIDYGEVQRSNPLADLARLLGDLEPLGGEAWQEALNCYESTMRKRIDSRFVWTLHQAGLVGAARHWLRQGVARQIPDRLLRRVAGRLDRLVRSLSVLVDRGSAFVDPALSRPRLFGLQ